jgi:hypothetical protein
MGSTIFAASRASCPARDRGSHGGPTRPNSTRGGCSRRRWARTERPSLPGEDFACLFRDVRDVEAGKGSEEAAARIFVKVDVVILIRGGDALEEKHLPLAGPGDAAVVPRDRCAEWGEPRVVTRLARAGKLVALGEDIDGAAATVPENSCPGTIG